ncbi:MAG: hypothetical protein AAGF19_04285 [Pseudomonadota bacterium]
MTGRPATFAAVFFAIAIVTSAFLASQMPDDASVKEVVYRWIGLMVGSAVAVGFGLGLGYYLDRRDRTKG